MHDSIRPIMSAATSRGPIARERFPLADDVHEREIAAARGFHQRLLHLPLGRWVEVALTDPHAERRAVTADPGALPSDSARDAEARAHLRMVLDRRPSMVAQVRERVSATAAAARGFTSDAVVARMTRVALCAELAIIARADLDAEQFARLYRPFERLIPVNQLPA